MKIEWTEPRKPLDNWSNYDHVSALTPLGICMIEWKSWKERPDYGVEIGDEYIDTGYSLEEAKTIAVTHLEKKRDDLVKFLYDGE